MVLISAWMPAPPLESLPAMVNAVFMIFSFPTAQFYRAIQGGAPNVPRETAAKPRVSYT
jgi:hypothetical protein